MGRSVEMRNVNETRGVGLRGDVCNGANDAAEDQRVIDGRTYLTLTSSYE